MEVWRALLAAGDSQAAWDTFIATYRRLIIATIRRTVINPEDAVEVFADICGELSSDGLAILKRHDASGGSRFSTWLVTVVHRRGVDWMRREYGRRRVPVPAGLSDLQSRIFRHVFVEQQTHAAAYELIRQKHDANLSFGAFLKELAGTYRHLEKTLGKSATHYLPGPPFTIDEPGEKAEAELLSAETGTQLASALKILAADERLAVQLFVIDELPAAKVASIVGWPGAKTVYNRVYRALAELRKELERRGLDRVST